MSKYMCNACGNIFDDRKDAALCCPDVVEVSDDGRTLDEIRVDYANEHGAADCPHKIKDYFEWGKCCWECGWAEGNQEEASNAL